MQLFKKIKQEYLITYLMCLLLFASVSPISAQSSQTIKPEQRESLNSEVLNEIGAWQFGRHDEAAIDEVRNLTFLNSGGVVLILDISSLSSPVLVNDSIRTSGVVKDLYYDSTTQNLYVTLGENGMEIWDVNNINSPQLLSSLFLDYFGTIPPANKMAVKLGFIFVAAEYAGIITVNVSDPENPYQSSFNLGYGGTKYAVDISQDGSFLVAASLNLTELYDVNPNGSISLLDTGAPLYGAWEIHISGNYSFQILQGVLYALDLSTIHLPVVDSYNLLGNSTDHYSITSSDNILFVSDPFYGIEIFDITNPASLIFLGSYETNCNDVKYFASNIFVPDEFGMKILDVSDPADPTLTGSYEGTGGIMRDIKISEPYCYIVTFFNFYIIDVSDPATPELTGSNQPVSGFDLHLLIQDNYAFITNGEEGLRVVDISNPADPVTVGNSSPAYFNYIEKQGNYLFVTDNQYHLKVYDVSNPAAPTEVGSLTFPVGDLTSGIAASNGYVYLTQYEAGLKVIDVSDPSQPVLVNQYGQNVYYTDVSVQGNYAYIVDRYNFYSNVNIFNISDPLNPVPIGTIVFNDPPPHAYKNYVFGDILYVGDATDPYLTLLDVSNPSNPVEISNQLIPDFYSGIDVTDEYIYLATMEAGLHIYENPYGGVVPVEFALSISPIENALMQNYPNPFNPSTTIRYSIPASSFVTLRVYDVLGNELVTLINEEKPVGSYQIEFDASTLPSGVYFYKLQAGSFVETKKMVLMK